MWLTVLLLDQSGTAKVKRWGWGATENQETNRKGGNPFSFFQPLTLPHSSYWKHLTERNRNVGWMVPAPASQNNIEGWVWRLKTIFNNWYKDQNNIITGLINKYETARNRSKDRINVCLAHHYIPSAYYMPGPQQAPGKYWSKEWMNAHYHQGANSHGFCEGTVDSNSKQFEPLFYCFLWEWLLLSCWWTL